MCAPALGGDEVGDLVATLDYRGLRAGRDDDAAGLQHVEESDIFMAVERVS